MGAETSGVEAGSAGDRGTQRAAVRAPQLIWAYRRHDGGHRPRAGQIGPHDRRNLDRLSHRLPRMNVRQVRRRLPGWREHGYGVFEQRAAALLLA
jgi:hypothetical protein